MTWTDESRGRPPRILAGRYEIRGLLGEGGMGQVFEGFDTSSINRPVAIKLLSLRRAGREIEEEDKQRFRREAAAAGRLSHPNIVQVFDTGVDSGQAYIIMELVRGSSLAQLIHRDGPMPPSTAIALMQGVLAGLHYCHQQDVIHCDIKPANIMLAPNGLAKITDFGIAQIKQSELTVANGQGGTPAYMAIEQCNDAETNACTDVYAAGAVLFEMLTGRRLVTGNSQASAIREIMDGIWPTPSSLAPAVTPGLDAAVARAIQLQPAARFQSAQEFSEALASSMEDINADRTVISPSPIGRPKVFEPLSSPSGKTVPNTRVLLPLAMGAGGLAAAFCVWLVWRGYLAAPPEPNLPAPRSYVPFPSPSPTLQPAVPSSSIPDTSASAQPGVPQRIEPRPAIEPTITLPAADPHTVAPVVHLPPAASPAQSPPASVLPVPALPVPTPSPAQVSQPIRSINQEVSDLVSATACSVLDLDMSEPDQVRLSGIGERGTVDKLVRDIEALAQRRVTRSVTSVNSVFCPLLDIVTASLAAGAERLQVTLPGSEVGLAKGRRIAPTVVGPRFPAQIVADYVTVGADLLPVAVHLTLTPAQTTKDMRVTLGLDRPNSMMLTVDAPYGVDLVVVLASSAVLDLGSRTYPPVDGASFFLKLKAALRDGQARGLRLGIGLLPVRTVE